jgi:hypothetical protein
MKLKVSIIYSIFNGVNPSNSLGNGADNNYIAP